MTIPYAQRLLRYDLWSNLRVLRALMQLPALTPEVPAARLFAHIIAAEEVWLTRLKGGPYAGRTFWPEIALKEWHARLQAAHEAWLDFLEDPVAEPDARFAYTNSKGELHETALQDVLTHLIIHGQHHRAQIALHLRAGGLTPPPTDFIYFTRDAVSDETQA